MFLIAICRQLGDKWQSKSLFQTIFHLCSSIVLTLSIAAYPVWFLRFKMMQHRVKQLSHKFINIISHKTLTLQQLHFQISLLFYLQLDVSSHIIRCIESFTKRLYLRELFTSKCHLLITSANSLDPDQARQNVGPDLDPICLTLRWYSWKNFSRKLILKKFSRQQKSGFPRGQRVKQYWVHKSQYSWFVCLFAP